MRSANAVVEALQSFLRTKLPDYMTPSTFVLLDSLPLTPNGKVDRRALPPPDQIGPEPEKTFAVPQTDLEQAIAAIWQEVLQIEAVSVHDSFFELGGNSVHLIRVHGKLRETLGKDLPVVKMFERPTVRSLADYISQEQERPFSFQPSADRADARHASRQRRTQARRQAGSNVETGDSE